MDLRLEEDALEESSEALPFFLASGDDEDIDDDEDIGDSADSFV